MNPNRPSISKKTSIDPEDVEIFEDSTLLANFENSEFKDSSAGFPEYIMNDSLNKTDLNISALCCDEEISGYDKLTGKTWIYPTNYPVRDYQYNIIQAAILKNTLVSLPTGLGKTFIAAVIMYNFYRWYPLGKIIFTAPTRPLVAQQIEACYDIIAIPPGDTIEMTGHMQVNTRKDHWQHKRVFFATPQVIYNDIKSGICPGDMIRCLVIDEAHRARGNYAYCQIMGALSDAGSRRFRVLALSATPGSKVEDVVNVIKNLHIAHLELRTETCIDVAKYSHSRKISTVVIQLGPELTQLRHQYVEILDGYARRLKQLNILPHNVGNLSKGRIVILYKEFQNKERGARHPQHNYIMKDFTILIALYHGLELLVKHGSRVFLNFFDEHPEKSWIQADDKLTLLLERLRDDLGVNPLSLDRSILPDGTIPELPDNLCFGHPKFYRLKEIMLEHFKLAKHKGQDTKAIVFCEYRESVNLVHCLLLQCRPLIQPQMFVGQGASGKDGKTVVSQKQQARVMRNFREGTCNTLVATCVAEEGLDVGSVDLILCFDISSRSPIRLVQRCGRTGRERGGQVFILVTEGREHQTLLDSMRQRDSLNNRILQSKEVDKSLYKMNPRMMPRDFKPVCQKMFITVAKKTDPKEKKPSTDAAKKCQKDLRAMLLGRKSASGSGSSKEFDVVNLISEEEFKELYPKGYHEKNFFDEPLEYWTMEKEKILSISSNEEQRKSKLATWLEWQRTLQNTVNIEHSRDTEIMASILQYGDAKRFDMPASTQNPCFNTQVESTQSQNAVVSSPAKQIKQTKKPKKVAHSKSPAKKDGDIRALFSTATKSTKNYTKLINDLGIQNSGNIPMKIIDLLVDLNLDNATTRPCYICQTICDCTLLQNVKQSQKKPAVIFTFLSDLKLPDVNLIDDIDAESILKCANTENNHHLDVSNENDNIEVNKRNCSNNFDLDFDFDSPMEVETPHKESETFTENVDAVVTNFDVGDIEDIFADDSPLEEANEIVEVEDKNTSDPKEALGFFGLDSIDDIFADSDDSTKVITPKVATPKKVNRSPKDRKIDPLTSGYPVSPSILSGRVQNVIDTSPILACSQVRKFKLSSNKPQAHSSTPSKAKRQLIKNDTQNAKQDLTKSSINLTNTSNNKSMFTITQLVEMINHNDDSVLKKSQYVAKEENLKTDLERSPSPILLTQAERLKSFNNTQTQKNINNNPASINSKSLIILDSDSDSDENTQIYDVSDKVNEISETEKVKASLVTNKRKFDNMEEELTASPYFNKKPKLSEVSSKATIQQKVLAALSSNKMCDDNDKSKDTNLNFMFSLTQNDNKNHNVIDRLNGKENELGKLQMFRRDIKTNGFTNKLDKVKCNGTQNRKLMFEDSDDDFVDDKPKSPTHCNNKHKAANHKVRKKNKKHNSFLDLEAALSDSDASGDELSDDSVGSIIDFICDESVTHSADVHAMYLRSVKSPVKGVFKIPELPKKRTNVLSQFVEEDSYEMDSFCVDSHIGLTQVNDISELELAEIALEQERKIKKKSKLQSNSIGDNDESPLIRNKKKTRRQIQSDSDDSS